MSYFTPEDGADVLKSSGNGNLPKIKDLLIDHNTKDGEKKFTVRPIGFQYRYVRYSPYTKVPSKSDPTKMDREPLDFPEDGRKGFYRVGVNPEDTAQYGECPYAKGGYDGQERFAQNVIELYEDGTFAVKILEGPKSLWEKFWNFQKSNAERNKARGVAKYVENLGGEKSHHCEVTAAVSKRGPGKGSDYSVQFLDLVEITDEEIEALEKAGKMPALDIAKIRADYAHVPMIASAPDWMFHGYNLKRIFKPQIGVYGQEGAGATPTAPAATSNDALEEGAPRTSGKASGKAVKDADVAIPAAPATADAEATDEEW